MKKILSIVLVFLLAVSVMPSGINLTASAATKRKSGIYTYTVSKGKATIIDCKSSAKGSIKIPSKIGKYRVKKIGSCAFQNCKKISEITIPKGVTKIGTQAFYKCSNLKNVTIPKGVTSIGLNAFRDCKKLKEITIPPSVTSIDNAAFKNCKKLKKIALPESVTSIGLGAFKNTGYYNSSKNWKNKVLYIGTHLIKAKDSIKSCSVKKGTKTIASGAFKDCKKLKKITIPKGVTSIGDAAFCNCKKLTKITIPKGVTSIGDSAFCNCKKLTKITIPKGVTKIGDWAFCRCRKLTSITIPKGVTSIGDGTFDECESITKITIPKGVTKIGDWTFKNCKKLKNIAIPTSVTSIGEGAFGGCESITKITIPKGVKKIGSGAFYDCKGLKEITGYENLINYGESGFYKLKLSKVIYKGSYEELFDNYGIGLNILHSCFSPKRIECNDGYFVEGRLYMYGEDFDNSDSNDETFGDSDNTVTVGDITITLKESHNKMDECSFKMSFQIKENDWEPTYVVIVALTIVNKGEYQINTASCYPELKNGSISYSRDYAGFAWVPKGGEQTCELRYGRVPAGNYTLTIDTMDMF